MTHKGGGGEQKALLFKTFPVFATVITAELKPPNEPPVERQLLNNDSKTHRGLASGAYHVP